VSWLLLTREAKKVPSPLSGSPRRRRGRRCAERGDARRRVGRLIGLLVKRGSRTGTSSTMAPGGEATTGVDVNMDVAFPLEVDQRARPIASRGRSALASPSARAVVTTIAARTTTGADATTIRRGRRCARDASGRFLVPSGCRRRGRAAQGKEVNATRRQEHSTTDVRQRRRTVPRSGPSRLGDEK